MKELLFKSKYFLFKPKTFKFFTEIKNSEKKSIQELEIESFEKFKKIFRYAYENSPFYKSKYEKAGITPDSLLSREQIESVPLLTKEEIRNHYKDIITKHANKRYVGISTTGGSSGIPVRTFFDKRVPIEAFGWRYLNRWGLNPWDDGAYIWRMIRKNKILNSFNLILWWPTKKIRLDASYLDNYKLDEFRFKINKYKPRLIQGYIGAVYEFADYLFKNKLCIHSPKCVWVTSAPMGKSQRKIIEEVFNAPVYDEYGSSEIPWLAAQCNRKELLHINFEGRLIEIVDDLNRKLGYDQEGKILITDLMNYYFPLIRYENGDKGSLSSSVCGCGSNLPLLNPVKGRVSDMIRNPYGKVLDGSFLTTMFDDITDCINVFQFYQKSDYRILLKVVPNKNFNSYYKIIENHFDTLKRNYFSDFDIELELMEEIKSDRGKTRFIISEIKS